MINKIRNLLSRRVPTQIHKSTAQFQLLSAACPYCGVNQDPPPQRRRMCRSCREPIYVLSDRAQRTKHLLTADDFNRIQQGRREDSNRIQQERRDAEWQNLSRLARDAMQGGDWGTLQGVYQQQASILFAEGRPHRHVASEACRTALMRMQEAGIKRVEVMTAEDERVCEHCQSMDGKVYDIQCALKTMPLPSANCSDGSQKNRHGGRCRCVYLAVL